MTLPRAKSQLITRLLARTSPVVNSLLAIFRAPYFYRFSNFADLETISLNSEGRRDILWSLPSKFLSNVKCFSITFAPRATAAIGTVIPLSCPEYPTILPLIFFKFSKYAKLTSLRGLDM